MKTSSTKHGRPTVFTQNKDKGTVKSISIDDIYDARMYMINQQKTNMLWNNEFVGKQTKRGLNIIEELKKVQLSGDSIIVQLYKEWAINPDTVSFTEDGKIENFSYSASAIDVRQRNTDAPHLIENPMNVIFKGVIVAMSPFAKIQYAKVVEEAKALGIEAVMPEVGDTVYMHKFITKDRRFYLNKTEMHYDRVDDPLSVSLAYFDYLFKISSFDIEAIVKTDKASELVDAKYPFEELFNQITPENIREYYYVDENRKV